MRKQECRHENHPGFKTHGQAHMKCKIGTISEWPDKMDLDLTKFKKKTKKKKTIGLTIPGNWSFEIWRISP